MKRINDGYEKVHGGWGFVHRNDESEALLKAALAFDLAMEEIKAIV